MSDELITLSIAIPSFFLSNNSSFCYFLITLYLLIKILRKNHSEKKGTRYFDGKEYSFNLMPFNDAISDELMKIRYDIINIKTQQWKDTKDFAWEKVPSDFLNNWYFFRNYPHSAVCEFYSRIENTERLGLIIIELDETVSMLINKNEGFSANDLQEIKSSKKNPIYNGMSLTVHLCEQDHRYKWEEFYDRNAKIISIENNFDGLNITLEIEIINERDHDYPIEKDKIENSRIIREIQIYCPVDNHLMFEVKKKEDD